MVTVKRLKLWRICALLQSGGTRIERRSISAIFDILEDVLRNPVNATRLDATKASELRGIIFREMIRTRPHKYKKWLRGMGTMRLLTMLCGEGIRAEIIVSLYAALHLVDDVVDGDVDLPAQYSTTIDYARRKVRFCARPSVPEDDVECLLLYALTLSERIGLDIAKEMHCILASMLFDAGRRDPLHPKAFRVRVLHKHFHWLDIEGTIGLCLKIFEEARTRHADLRELGEASRIQYTLKDVDEDFRAGYCNIPLEDVERLGIHVFDSTSSPVQKWCTEESERGLQLLQEHRRKVKRLPLRFLTRIVLPLFYEWPARKFFNSIR